MTRASEIKQRGVHTYLQVDFKSPDFKVLPTETVQAIEALDGVVYAYTESLSAYDLVVVIGDLYTHKEMFPRILAEVDKSVFNQTLLERANEVIPVPNNINDFLLWMGTATVIGAILARII